MIDPKFAQLELPNGITVLTEHVRRTPVGNRLGSGSTSGSTSRNPRTQRNLPFHRACSCSKGLSAELLAILPWNQIGWGTIHGCVYDP